HMSAVINLHVYAKPFPYQGQQKEPSRKQPNLSIEIPNNSMICVTNNQNDGAPSYASEPTLKPAAVKHLCILHANYCTRLAWIARNVAICPTKLTAACFIVLSAEESCGPVTPRDNAADGALTFPMNAPATDANVCVGEK